MVAIGVRSLRAGHVSLQFNTVPTAIVVTVADGGGIHVAVVVVCGGYLHADLLEVVDGIPASLEVGLAVLLNVPIETNPALELAVLLCVCVCVCEQETSRTMYSAEKTASTNSLHYYHSLTHITLTSLISLSSSLKFGSISTILGGPPPPPGLRLEPTESSPPSGYSGMSDNLGG